jgi:small-conductance mechanosensitive channel
MIRDLRNILEYSFRIGDRYEISVFEIILVLLIFAATRFLVWSFRKFLRRRFFTRGTLDEGRKFAFVQLFRYFVSVIAILLSFQVMGINITLLLAGSAALLVGIGLGLQQTFNDLVSGLILLFEGNVSVGDIIEINALVGRVTAIGLRTSKVETRDAITIIVPNSKFIVDNVINWSHNNKLTRFTVHLRASYNSDPEKIRQVLMDCVRQHRDIVEKPAPIVRLQNFGEAGLEFDLLFWTYNVWRIETLKSDIRFGIFKSFKENGIAIPYPQRDLHIKTETDNLFLPSKEQSESAHP